MARPANKFISEKEQQQLLRNMEAMEGAFSGRLIEGKKLHLLKRYFDEQETKNGSFKEQLQAEYPILAEALEEKTLPSGKTLTKHFVEGAPYKTVERLAKFCTNVFAFSRQVTADDLLTKNLRFPPMRKIGGLWGRYSGIYRCFYLEPNEKEEPLSGALLELKEVKGNLICRMIVGIKTAYCFDKAADLLKNNNSSKSLTNHLDCLNTEDENDSKQMYYYEGTMDNRTIPEYHLIQLHRYESQHTMSVFLRSWSRSKKPEYSGGIAMVVRCRIEEMLNYPMLVTRQRFSLHSDEELILKYLTDTLQENSLKASKYMDESFDHEER